MEQVLIDRRLRRISYSSRELFALCERKFELYRKNKKPEETSEILNSKSGCNFAFGHLVGEGIQLTLQGHEWDTILFQLFLHWKPDLMLYVESTKKSFWHGILAVQKFRAAYEAGLLEGWEILSSEEVLTHFGTTEAVEVPFAITLPNGFIYIGFVDAILWHPETGRVMILEIKTTASKIISPAQYKNSSQALGYSVILDKLFPDLSSYDVKYLIYSSTMEDWTVYDFGKSFLARAQWLQELLMDCQRIELCEKMGVFPMRGGSCRSFNQDCQYFENPACTMSNAYVTDPLTPEWEAVLDKELEDVKFFVTFEELVQAQLDRSM